MFAQSYDPFGFVPLQPPHTDEERKRRVDAHRRHVVEGDRQRYAELERMKRADEKSKINKDPCGRSEERPREEERQRRRNIKSLPNFPSAAYSDVLPPRDAATCPPRTILLKRDYRKTTPSHQKRQITRRGTSFSSICTDEDYENEPNAETEDDAPPHIIAENDDTDDEDEDLEDDLISVWISKLPNQAQNSSLRQDETAQ